MISCKNEYKNFLPAVLWPNFEKDVTISYYIYSNERILKCLYLFKIPKSSFFLPKNQMIFFILNIPKSKGWTRKIFPEPQKKKTDNEFFLRRMRI